MQLRQLQLRPQAPQGSPPEEDGKEQEPATI